MSIAAWRRTDPVNWENDMNRLRRIWGCFFLDAGALGLKLGGDGLYFTEEDHRHFAEAIRKKVEGIWEGD